MCYEGSLFLCLLVKVINIIHFNLIVCSIVARNHYDNKFLLRIHIVQRLFVNLFPKIIATINFYCRDSGTEVQFHFSFNALIEKDSCWPHITAKWKYGVFEWVSF